MEPETLRGRASTLPREPGVYTFYSGERTLYVGKAVDLRDRVRSYVDPRSNRIKRMVEQAEDIDIAVTDTESQALLLEANLIKREAPKYNVRLKDDKSYPLVQFTDHSVPRIEITRDPDEGATVYGPFTNRGRLETVCKAIRDSYGLRGCSDHKYADRDRPCLDYELGLCSAPCTGEIDEPAYREDVTAARRFFEGATGALAEPLRRAMETAAQEQAFERAATLRDRLEVVESFHGDGGDAVRARDEERTVDVLGVSVDGTEATVARLHSEDGQLVERDRHTLDAPVDAGADRVVAVLTAFLSQYYAERTLPDAVLVQERPDDEELRNWLDSQGVDLRVPGAGREATLVDLALKNASRSEREHDGRPALCDALGLAAADRIEGVDVSHAQGKAVVGSNVTFVDGSRESADYRRKQLAEENDDYANMRRLVTWRAQRAVEGRDDRPDPDLLLVDGGDGQLEAATDALSTVGWDVPAVAIAKGEDGDRIITTDGSVQVPEQALTLLQQVRDEAHRFAVQYHQTVRDEVSTTLDDLDGIGPALRDRLLGRFGSVDDIRAASVEELRDVTGIGEETATRIDDRL
jgi:excinuclease ABC subunit C